jgi:Fic family protein
VKVPLTPPPLSTTPTRRLAHLFVRVSDDDYLHWDDVFHRPPPTGITTLQWWEALKARRYGGRAIALRPLRGPHFTFNLPDRVQEMLLKIDQSLAGRIGVGEQVVTPALRDKYVLSSLSEEAITSSQLEGASTSRRVAKEMLRTGRAPKDRGEQMIANNFRAMEFIRDHVAESLTPDLVLEVQRIVTDGTLEHPEDAGRLQLPGDTRVRVWGDNDQVLHTPPPAEELPDRLKAMCEFANGGGAGFVHPVVRAVLLHFWLAYDHPFADGNGRTARILFYWSMLRQGYWLTEFVSISTILRKAPSKYARSFLLTETDDNDLTYFLLYHLDVILRAITALTAYVERKTREVRSAERLVKSVGRLNHRQLDLLGHALRNSDASYTVQSHRRSHGVVYETARSDLLDLAALGLLVQRKTGKAFRFSPAPDVEDRLARV